MRRLAFLGVVVGLAVAALAGEAAPQASASKSAAAALLAAAPEGGVWEPESDTAREVAVRLTGATVIVTGGGGGFVDGRGRQVQLGQFRVVWCYQGEPIEQKGALFDPATVKALRSFVEGGGGLLLSGGAAALTGPLGLDTLRIKPMVFGQDREQAGLVPAVAEHPAFRDVDLERGVLWMSNAAFLAFAEFHPLSSPAKGLVLARTPGGPENPLMEYELGEGRVVVMGWRVGRQYGDAAEEYRGNFERLAKNLVEYLADRKAWRPLVERGVSERADAVSEGEWRALELAIRDLRATFGERYARGAEYEKRLEALKARGSGTAGEFRRLRDEALLANPLLDFSRLLVVQRGEKELGLPMNYLSNSSLPQTGYDNQIAVLSPVRPDGKLTTLYRPEGGRFVGDVDLHFDADRMLFSMPAGNGRWGVFEIGADGSKLRQVKLIEQPDVDNYDACYLPDGRIVFCSTACFTGVPCINGTGHVCNLYLRERDGRVRQLTVEQDHDWCPTVMNNGKVLYLRWEYTDLPHAFSRILFHMNPDGTEQLEYYGSGSYWPGTMFYARPIPGHPTKVVAVVGGHHELPRMGDLVIFDPARGRIGAEGAVQRIPGYGRKVTPALLDLPIAQSWPKFLHPYPLSEKYFLVSCKPSASAPWGIYLVDVFDNMVLLHEQRGYAMLEPIPLRKTVKPPVIPDKVDVRRKDAEMLITDIYRGEGLPGVPRGTIKSLRVISYQFGYQGMGAEPHSVGLDGPWDPRLVLGTVPVQADGSARFRVPAYTPIALQPLDAEGKAVQLMRSWITAMPGEVVSCTGCHEKQNTSVAVRGTMAARQEATRIKPWYGPARGFAFRREVQPVLDKYCVQCHDGEARAGGGAIPDLVDRPSVPTLKNAHSYNLASRFSPSYYQLRRFVRTPTKEYDMRVLRPWEFHADTTRLVQLLQKGHYNVKVDAEAWDRLITWIDLNAPAHGNWTDIRGEEIGAAVRQQWERRRAMRKLYAGMDDDPEAIYPAASLGAVVKVEREAARKAAAVECPGWPMIAGEAKRKQETAGLGAMAVPLGGGIVMEMAPVPAGEFVMGAEDGGEDERPAHRAKVGRAFWMGCYEVTNEQFALFDPGHDSRFESGDYIQFSPGERGWPVNRPKQPVVRVSWKQAMGFCDWLSKKAGRRFTLPTEAQWEWACRAGTGTPLWWGGLDSDFSRFANMADASLQAIDPFGWTGRTEVLPAWRPADTRFNDHSRVSAPVGSYRANAWGLYDMHGNAAEWTRSEYRPYGGGEKMASGGKRVVRGGSWYDRPERCRSGFRQAYDENRPVYDVGFRVICE